MSKHNEWSETAPQTIYEAYPDHDLLPIEPPKAGEGIGDFRMRAEDAADTLFLFLCREAADEIDGREYVARLDRAIRDIEAVREAFRENLNAGSDAPQPSFAAKPTDSQPDKRDVTIKLSLDADWIELSLTYADARGRRSGSVTSSLHTSEDDAEEFNAAMDAVESMVRAHACAGIDVTDPRYAEGVRTCIDACANNLSGGDE
jgi:hypothetical protein